MSYERVAISPTHTLQEWARKRIGLCERDERRVHCCVINAREYESEEPITYNLYELDPYRDCYFLVAVASSPTLVIVVGWFTYADLHAWEGRVHVKQLQSLVPRPKVLEREQEKKEPSPLSFFYLPFRGPRDVVLPEYPALLSNDAFNMPLVRMRLDHIANGLAMDFPLPENPVDEYVSYWACMGIGHAMEMSEDLDDMRHLVQVTHTRYEEARLRAERKRLDFLLQPFLQHHDALLQLLYFNGFREYVDDFMKLEPQPVDQYFYWKRQVDSQPLPFVFKVFMEQLPIDLSRLLPIHPYGLMHVPPRDMGTFFKHEMLNDGFRAQREPLEEMTQSLYELSMEIRELVEDTGGAFGRDRTQPLPFVPRAGKENVDRWSPDLKTLLSLVPPCFRRIMMTPDFPKNESRRFLVYAFRDAEISFDTINAWFEYMNRTYPKEDATTTTKVRFDVEYAWAQTEVLSPSCKTIIEKYTRGCQGGNSSLLITCPYAVGNVRDIEDIRWQCTKECAPAFFKNPVSSPKSVIKWNGRCKRRNEVSSK